MQNQIPEAAEVTLIDGVKGERVGVMPLREARAYAKEARCILKCVSGSPKPVFKTVTAAEVEAMHRQQQEHKEAAINAAREKKKLLAAFASKTKELKLTVQSGAHDIEVKARNARRFLAKGLMVDVKFTGPKRGDPGTGVAQNAKLDEFLAALDDVDGMEVRERTLAISKGGYHMNATASCAIYVPADTRAEGMKKEAVAQAVLAGRADGQRIGPIASAAENMARVGAQADKVRSMKAAKAPNDQIAAEILILQALKKGFTGMTGKEAPATKGNRQLAR